VILGRRRARGSEKCKRVRVGFVDVGVVADELENRQEPDGFVYFSCVLNLFSQYLQLAIVIFDS
jgi:hypothetical protein